MTILTKPILAFKKPDSIQSPLVDENGPLDEVRRLLFNISFVRVQAEFWIIGIPKKNREFIYFDL